MSFRDIATATKTTLPAVKQTLADAPPGKMRRELRQEIKDAGGVRRWWDQ